MMDLKSACLVAAMAAMIVCPTGVVCAGAVPCVQACGADISHNGVVDIDDLLMVVNNWGDAGGEGDVNLNGFVDIDDLLEVVNRWGESCPAAGSTSCGDECSSAYDLGVASQGSPLAAMVNTNGHLPGVLVPVSPCTSLADGEDVWFKFQIDCTGPVIGWVTTCDGDTDFDTILTLYRGTCDKAGLQLIDCNDDSDADGDCVLGKLYLKSRIELPAIALPGDYFVRVSGYNGAGGNVRVKVIVNCGN